MIRFPHILSRCHVLAAGLAALMLAGGCELKAPSLPTPVANPDVAVTRVDLVASSSEASRYDLVLTLTNPNDVALPLTSSDYTVAAGGASYKGDSLPNATIPASGSVSVTLPAVIAAAPGSAYSAEGTIEYFPPGQIKRLFYEMGWPKPRAHFTGSGTVQPKKVEEKKGPPTTGRIESDPVPPAAPAAPGSPEPRVPTAPPPQ